jgi:dimethylamine monooxygenase subunit A
VDSISPENSQKPDQAALSGCPFHSSTFPEQDLLKKRAGYDGIQKLDIAPLDRSDWFRFSNDYQDLLSAKSDLIDSQRQLVYQALPESEAGAKELFFTVVNWLKEHTPDKFLFTDVDVTNITTGYRALFSSADPLLELGMLVEDDLVLLHKHQDNQYKMVAGFVCFPSNWSLNEKLGKSVREIHEPVHDLNHLIGDKIDAFLDILKVDKPQSRINFLVNFNPRLSQIPELKLDQDLERPRLTPENIGDVLWLRNERETFTKLPESGDILFTLKTYQTPLREVTGKVARTIAELHQRLPENYRDFYRKLKPDEHQMLIDFLLQKSADNLPDTFF